MDSRILDAPHAQFGGSLGGMVGFPYHLSHHHVYELAGHQLQSASAVPFSIDGLLNGSCAAAVGNSSALLSSGCGLNGDNQQYKLTGEPHDQQHSLLKDKEGQTQRRPDVCGLKASFYARRVPQIYARKNNVCATQQRVLRAEPLLLCTKRALIVFAFKLHRCVEMLLLC